MTNAEKYLKDGVSVEEFAKSIVARFFGDDCFNENDYLRIKNWAEDNYPTLTEDERVILRNINNEIYTKIGRDVDTELYIAGNTIFRGDRIPQKDILEIILKPNLFQFIKERRRIRDKGVVRK